MQTTDTKIIGYFYSILFLLKKIKDQDLFHECIPDKESEDEKFGNTRKIFGTLFIYGEKSENKICLEKNGRKIICTYNYSDIIKNEGYRKVFIPIKTDDYHFLINQNYCVIDSSLRNYIENDFKTDEEIRFEEQMKVMKAELEEAQKANKDAKEQAETQIVLTRKALSETRIANRIAIGAVVVSAICGIITAVLTFIAPHVPTTIDPTQMQELRNSIVTPKTVKVSNEKISVDAKVDTINVKPVDVKNVKLEDTEKK